MVLSSDTFNRGPAFLHGSQTDGSGSLDPLTWSSPFAYDATPHGLTCSGGQLLDGGNDISTLHGYHVGVVDLLAANVTLNVDVGAGLSAAMSAGIPFRVTNSSNFWYAGLASDTSLNLYKSVATVETLVATTTAASATGTLRVVLNGSVISVSVNGTVLITATDSFNSTATKHGVAMRNDPASVLNACTLDNWNVLPAAGWYIGQVGMAG